MVAAGAPPNRPTIRPALKEPVRSPKKPIPVGKKLNPAGKPNLWEKKPDPVGKKDVPQITLLRGGIDRPDRVRRARLVIAPLASAVTKCVFNLRVQL